MRKKLIIFTIGLFILGIGNYSFAENNKTSNDKENIYVNNKELDLAVEFIKNKSFLEAVNILKNTNKSDPLYDKKMKLLGGSYLGLGSQYLDQDKYQLSKEAFLKAKELSKTTLTDIPEDRAEFIRNSIKISLKTVNAIISLNMYKKGDYKNSIPIFKEIISDDPDDPKFYSLLGLSLYKVNKVNESIAFFKLATEKFPNEAIILYNFACVQSLENNINESLKYLEKSILIKNEYKIEAKRDKDFENIKLNKKFILLTEE